MTATSFLSLLSQIDEATLALELSKRTVALADATLVAAKAGVQDAKANLEALLTQAVESGLNKGKIKAAAEDRLSTIITLGLVPDVTLPNVSVGAAPTASVACPQPVEGEPKKRRGRRSNAEKAAEAAAAAAAAGQDNVTGDDEDTGASSADEDTDVVGDPNDVSEETTEITEPEGDVAETVSEDVVAEEQAVDVTEDLVVIEEETAAGSAAEETTVETPAAASSEPLEIDDLDAVLDPNVLPEESADDVWNALGAEIAEVTAEPVAVAAAPAKKASIFG